MRDLRRRGIEGLDLGDGGARVDDPEVADGRHAGGDVVARDHLPGRDRERHGAQVDAHHPVGERDQHDEPRPLDGQQPAEPEDDGALVLAHDLDVEQRRGEQRDEQDSSDDPHGHSFVRFCDAHRLRGRRLSGAAATKPKP